MKYDADGDASIEAEEEYHLIYDTSWRAIMTRRYTDTAASVPAYKDRTIYHNAGLGGYGGSGYTDAVVLRDADMTNLWSGAADGTLEDRQYQCNNWRGDVVAILDDAGRMIEQVRYTPYGVPFALPAGDSDSDGDWDGTDVTNIGGGYDIREDSDLDGDADFDDFTHSNNRAGGSALYLGWKFLSSAYCANRKGYAAYEHDAAAPATLAHVRYRVYNFTLGRWTQRDPAGYVDGSNLYGYVGGWVVLASDPSGLDKAVAIEWILNAYIGPRGGDVTFPGLPHTWHKEPYSRTKFYAIDSDPGKFWLRTSYRLQAIGGFASNGVGSTSTALDFPDPNVWSGVSHQYDTKTGIMQSKASVLTIYQQDGAHTSACSSRQILEVDGTYPFAPGANVDPAIPGVTWAKSIMTIKASVIIHLMVPVNDAITVKIELLHSSFPDWEFEFFGGLITYSYTSPDNAPSMSAMRNIKRKEWQFSIKVPTGATIPGCL